jgi:hypothetical protein
MIRVINELVDLMKHKSFLVQMVKAAREILEQYAEFKIVADRCGFLRWYVSAEKFLAGDKLLVDSLRHKYGGTVATSVVEKHQAMVRQLVGEYLLSDGPSEGDYLKIARHENEYRRIAHIHEFDRESGKMVAQFESVAGASYCFTGSMTMSGSLDSTFKCKINSQLCGLRMGRVWVCKDGILEAGCSLDCFIPVKVFKEIELDV